MKKLFIPLAGVCLLIGSAAQASSLIDAIRAAGASDPQLRESEANRLAALEAKPQARAGWLPQISGFFSEAAGESDGSSASQQFVPTDDGDVFQTFSTPFKTDLNEEQSWQLELRQTVFQWETWVALAQADTTIAQADADYQAAEQGLFVRVSERYFDVLAAEDTLESTVATKEAVARQLEQAETRFEVGLIAITDVREAQAAHDEAIAAEIAAKRALATAKELLREFTDEYPTDLFAPGSSMPLAAPTPNDVEAWVETAMRQNLRVLSSQLAVQLANQEIKSRRGGHYPTVDIVLTRSDFDQDSDRRDLDIDARGADGRILGELGPWEVSDSDRNGDRYEIRLSMPIYSGGRTSSRVREAVYQHRAAKERLERVMRETERLTRDSYEGVISEIARVEALRKALQSSETALQATEAGFEVGTRTTVDVLNARRDLFRARTNYLRSRYDYILNTLNLKFAAGMLAGPDLEEVNGWLTEPSATPPATGG